MDPDQLQHALRGLPIGPLLYFPQTGSTNDEARRWAAAGASDLALVLADEQTAGRGRAGRRWLTPPGSALALSLVLRPDLGPSANPMHLTALGALAVCSALEALWRLRAEIKWPNDVLVGGRKLAGVLVEAQWQGDILDAAILGIGLNVARRSAPPDEQVFFPATSLEAALGRPVDRWQLLRAVLEGVLEWRSRLGSAPFLRAWEQRLAFKGQWVTFSSPDGPAQAEGQVLGLDPQGALRLLGHDGSEQVVQAGELRLRPVDDVP